MIFFTCECSRSSKKSELGYGLKYINNGEGEDLAKLTTR